MRIDPLGLTELNLFSPGDGNFYERAMLYSSPAGVFTVAGHGAQYEMRDAHNYSLTAQQLGNLIKDHPKYKNSSQIQLASCNVGKGSNNFAQQLANNLGKPVRAPDNFVFFPANGMFI